MGGGGGGGVWSGGGGGQGGEVFVKIQKKIFAGGSDGSGSWGGSDQGLGWGGSKIWGRWLMWGMGDVNQE